MADAASARARLCDPAAEVSAHWLLLEDGTAEALVAMRARLPEDAVWSAFGIGREEFPILAVAAGMGGNVRVGLEDNLYLSRGVLAPSNAAPPAASAPPPSTGQASRDGSATADRTSAASTSHAPPPVKNRRSW